MNTRLFIPTCLVALVFLSGSKGASDGVQEQQNMCKVVQHHVTARKHQIVVLSTYLQRIEDMRTGKLTKEQLLKAYENEKPLLLKVFREWIEDIERADKDLELCIPTSVIKTGN